MFEVVQGKELRYCVYAHPDHKKEKLPLVVFLHGAGERGNSLDETKLVLKIALPAFLMRKGLSPRCFFPSLLANKTKSRLCLTQPAIFLFCKE